MHLLDGFSGELETVTLHLFSRDSLSAREASPSQAKNPILDPSGSTTFRCISIWKLTLIWNYPSNPS